ncbi:MAG TPA: hypothetical protein VK599_13365 [Streptosporangiaceae bacterium]|nr:hypothetical protein [Streptosporangiaceae bacterium]
MADRTRRGVLAATAASLPLLALSGCKGIGALAAPPRPAPDVAVLRHAIAAEVLMIARYSTAIKGSASLAKTLAPLRAEHHLHLTALRARLIVPPGSAAASSQPPGHPAPSPRPVPAGAAAVSFLQDAEQAAAEALLRDLHLASPSLAQLMASVAASESTHVTVLAAAAGGTGPGSS